MQNFANFLQCLPDNGPGPHVSPLENIAPHEQPPLDAATWLPQAQAHSQPSTAYSGSPTASPPLFAAPPLHEHGLALHAPQPQHAFPQYAWADDGAQAHEHGQGQGQGLGLQFGLEQDQHGMEDALAQYHMGLESFHIGGCGEGLAPDCAPGFEHAFAQGGFELSDYIHEDPAYGAIN